MEDIKKDFDLQAYLTRGAETVMKDIMKTALKSPAACLSMMQLVRESKRASAKRRTWKLKGKSIPPFLIASITTQCNLHCKGCYARAHQACVENDNKDILSHQLSAVNWADLFSQAAELGVSFILLAGGEPFMRKDVLLAAGARKEILFPVFTNGTMMDDAGLDLLCRHRNLIPVLSMEGNEETTDRRRGRGVNGQLLDAMVRLKDREILFGASVTVHKENMDEVLGADFLHSLKASGCKAVIYVEYVPVEPGSERLALEEEDRDRMMERLKQLRKDRGDMLFLAFPGDENATCGCLAAGRGFFHINAWGSAEPCPFSPYSDTNLKEVSLEEALDSPLFTQLREDGILFSEHMGGCVLFQQEDKVKERVGK